MLDILKLFGAPGSIPLLVIATLAGLAVVRFSRGFRRAGWIGLGAVTIGYAVLALPVVANGIANALPPLDRAKDPRDSISTLVVLDGDNRRGRVREVQRVLSTDSPTTIWVLGGRWILEALEDEGVSGPAFRYDALATTTRVSLGPSPGSTRSKIWVRLSRPSVNWSTNVAFVWSLSVTVRS